jgi:septum site-determining protein MinC
MRDLISIKGGKDGLRMQFDEAADWHALLTALKSDLDEKGGFFAGAHLLLDVGDRAITDQQLAEVLELMRRHGVQPDELASTARESRNVALAAGLRTRVATLASQAQNHAVPGEQGEATLLMRTVRSGQVVRHQGHVTLIGDVNPGAEVIAGGSVVVWGRLRGLVHAGALGDKRAVICALELRPPQLRIANVIARTPEDNTLPMPVPEVARVDAQDQERMIVEPWEDYRR